MTSRPGPVTITVVELRADASVMLQHDIDHATLSVSSTSSTQSILQCFVEGERLVIESKQLEYNNHPLSYHAATLISFLVCAHLLTKAPIERFKSPLEVVVRWYITFTLACWFMRWLLGKVFDWFMSAIQYSYKLTVHLVSLEEIFLGSHGVLLLDQSLFATHIDVHSTGGSLVFHRQDRRQQQEQHSIGLGHPVYTMRLHVSGRAVINGHDAVIPHVQVINRAGVGHVTGVTASQQLTVVTLGGQDPPYQVLVASTPICVKQALRGPCFSGGIHV